MARHIVRRNRTTATQPEPQTVDPAEALDESGKLKPSSNPATATSAARGLYG